MNTKKKILNDPVYGFINIPGGLLFELIEHPYFQRLRRIKQLGLTYLVFPGAVHTRFQHAIGCMHLINLAIDVLRSKGHNITEEEADGARIAILLHDIGHGPFSHALESCIIPNHPHEELSLMFMQELNNQYNGKLELAIKIFKDEYHKKFLHQLVSGQLDMDRLDYLRRDSFFTGVTEGVVGSERIIKMLQVVDDNLVVEAKGIYSVEKFLIARRLMYWQVYLHKTVLVGELQLIHFLKRLKHLYQQNKINIDNKYLKFFLDDNKNKNNKEILDNFSMLDDFDFVYLVKQLLNHDDKIISYLANSLMNRKFPKIIIGKDPIPDNYIKELKLKTSKRFNLSSEELEYYVFSGEVSNNTYRVDDERINIQYGNKLIDIAEASDMLNISVLSKVVKKYYVCVPKIILNKD
ncbi:MAG: HD domain-containing protein [Bacteroidales bacterium]